MKKAEGNPRFVGHNQPRQPSTHGMNVVLDTYNP